MEHVQLICINPVCDHLDQRPTVRVSNHPDQLRIRITSRRDPVANKRVLHNGSNLRIRDAMPASGRVDHYLHSKNCITVFRCR